MPALKRIQEQIAAHTALSLRLRGVSTSGALIEVFPPNWSPLNGWCFRPQALGQTDSIGANRLVATGGTSTIVILDQHRIQLEDEGRRTSIAVQSFAAYLADCITENALHKWRPEGLEPPAWRSPKDYWALWQTLSTVQYPNPVSWFAVKNGNSIGVLEDLWKLRIFELGLHSDTESALQSLSSVLNTFKTPQKPIRRSRLLIVAGLIDRIERSSRGSSALAVAARTDYLLRKMVRKSGGDPYTYGLGACSFSDKVKHWEVCEDTDKVLHLLVLAERSQQSNRVQQAEAQFLKALSHYSCTPVYLPDPFHEILGQSAALRGFSLHHTAVVQAAVASGIVKMLANASLPSRK